MPATTIEEANQQIADLQAQLRDSKASGGSAVRLTDLEAKLGDAETARLKMEAELRETRAQLDLDRARDRLTKFVLKGKLTRPLYARALRLCEIAIRGGAQTIQLATKVSVAKIRLAEGDTTGTEEIDKLDVVGEVLDMLQELPDAIAVTPNSDLALDDSDPKEGNDEDELDKVAKAEMKENPKLRYREAVVLADKKRRAKV